MLPLHLRFPFRKHPDFFERSRWISIPGAKEDAFLRSLSFRVQSKPTGGLQWAVVVPKKVGNAVQRAKMKRLVRESIVALSRSHSTDFDLSYNVVVHVRSKVERFSDVEQIITHFLSALSKTDKTSAPSREK